jgi:hypothetical protein
MDPTATLEEYLDACRYDDREVRETAGVGLSDWLLKGGCLPDLSMLSGPRTRTLLYLALHIA